MPKGCLYSHSRVLLCFCTVVLLYEKKGSRCASLLNLFPKQTLWKVCFYELRRLTAELIPSYTVFFHDKSVVVIEVFGGLPFNNKTFGSCFHGSTHEDTGFQISWIWICWNSNEWDLFNRGNSHELGVILALSVNDQLFKWLIFHSIFGGATATANLTPGYLEYISPTLLQIEKSSQIEKKF